MGNGPVLPAHGRHGAFRLAAEGAKRVRFLLVASLLAGFPLFAQAQVVPPASGDDAQFVLPDGPSESGLDAQPAGPSPTSPIPSALLPDAADPATAAPKDAPGEGVTISMLNGTTRLKLFANFSALGIFSTDRPFVEGLPLFLLPASPFGLNTNTFDLHSLQSSVGAVLTGPEICGFSTGATFLAFFYNGNLVNANYGILPYNAYGELKNDRWRFAAGLQFDVFNPRNPTTISLARLFGSGNTGSVGGQVRLEHFLKPTDELAVTLQGALSEPIDSLYDVQNARLLEDNGWPNVEGRVLFGIGAETELAGGRKLRPLELGVSGVVGQVRSRGLRVLLEDRPPVNSVVDVWGLGADTQLAVTDRSGFAGEFFIGRGLGDYNGGILQFINATTFQGIRSRGGWGEVYCYFNEKFHLHAGYGIDAPIDRDVAPTQILRNQTYYANMVCDLNKTLQISFEVDYRRTDYIQFLDADGVLFYTQFLWRF